MANMASVSYRIEGPKEDLKEINDAIVEAIKDDEHWTEWSACRNLGFSEEYLDDKRLGGGIEEEPSLEENTLEFYAEERWGLQDFEEVLRQKFPEIKVSWIVEEPGCEVYATTDKEGKYFPDRYYCELCKSDQIDQDYFETEEDMFQWLSQMTNGKIKNWKDVDAYELECDDENYIIIHQFEVID